MHTHPTTNSNLFSVAVEVNLNEVDAKGRSICKVVHLEEVVPTCYGFFKDNKGGFEVLTDNGNGYGSWRHENRPNEFSIRIHTFKNGKKFGAYPNASTYATKEEAVAAFNKKVAALQKKAATNNAG